jgi:hypothetical protein
MSMPAIVGLWNEIEQKALAIQTDDLGAFLGEIKENSQGYVILAVKPLGEIDPVLWEQLIGAEE